MPLSVAVGVVDERPSVWREAHGALLCRSVGDAACGLVLDICDIYVAAEHKCEFLSIGRYGHRGGTGVDIFLHHVAVILVGGDGYSHFAWLLARAHGIELSVPTEGESAVGSHRERAHGMALERGEDLTLLAVERGVCHVKSAVLFGNVVIAFAVGSPYRVEVMAVEVRELCEVSAVEQPDVGGAGGALMFTPHVFHPFLVLK